MPKLKSHSGAKKRFKVTKGGKVKYTKANRRHILNKKSTKVKRGYRAPSYLNDKDAPAVKEMLPYA